MRIELWLHKIPINLHCPMFPNVKAVRMFLRFCVYKPEEFPL